MQYTTSEIEKAWFEIPEKRRNNAIIDAMHPEHGRSVSREQAKRLVYEKFKQDLIDKNQFDFYQNGAEGCCKWMEDNLRVKIIPRGMKEYTWVYLKELPDYKDKHNRSFRTYWERQQEVLHEALATDSSGIYKHNLIAFVLPRSFGKSFLVIGICLYRAFCFTYQKLYLSATTKQQANIMHFEEAKAAIFNSPQLLEQVGVENILQDKIRLRMGIKNDVNIIRTLTDSGEGSGLCSNASVVTMSEAYAMESDRFFGELYGSIRTIPNAMCLIDSTTSKKTHWLYERVYRGARKYPEGKIFVKYIGMKDVTAKNFWNPGMTTEELQTYKVALTRYDFNRFFKNLWGELQEGLFDKDTIEAISYLGVDGLPVNHQQVLKTIQKIRDKGRQLRIQDQQVSPALRQIDAEKYRQSLMRVDDFINLSGYRIDDDTTIASPGKWPKMNDVKAVVDAMMVDRFALLVGVDCAQSEKKGTTGAKTIMVWIAKIPAGKVFRGLLDDPYLYLILGIASIGNHLTAPMLKVSTIIHDEFGIDAYGGDKYRGSDELGMWCDEKGVHREFSTATLQVQQAGFREMINALHNGLFKAPPMPVSGIVSGDILREELRVFDVIGKSKTGTNRYGSPQKLKRDGIQDDVMDAICMALYAGRKITTDKMKNKFDNMQKKVSLISMIPGDIPIQERYNGLYSF